ncbi:uncharacterized protein BDR25DRAFT_302778 [Lindgomyces ingoldianus]|uniref:Uncharacterized protein n=1 Tax=Lindgomyces ingoldianus TaxID=673940 RepID=A0ACB6R0V0_9PLEO|nr:uncharacterized protein BDR25DRAFT_302778 [Lindgomyces ingoldianus]KAF2471950.1 hypothetical protein BDR25DRAFT_302778 [Lindgomyces ingoldianus]
MAPPPPSIDLLLNLIDTRPKAILTSLAQYPHLASASDSHGYSLVHAAASYNQLEVLRELVQKYHVNVNLLDEDGESPLFAAENAEVARCLVEELGADWEMRNSEGRTAEEKMVEEDEAHEVCRYLNGLRDGGGRVNSGELPANQAHPLPPPPPNGVKINVGMMEEAVAGETPDPEFRRRIEELASREDFQGEEGQRQLRELVTEAVTGLGTDQTGRSVRRRME